MKDIISNLIVCLTYKQQYHLNFPKLKQNAFTTTNLISLNILPQIKRRHFITVAYLGKVKCRTVRNGQKTLRFRYTHAVTFHQIMNDEHPRQSNWSGTVCFFYTVNFPSVSNNALCCLSLFVPTIM